MMRDRNRQRLSKFRRDLKRGEPYSETIDIHRRLVEISEELRRTDNRTKVLALECERKVMAALGELLGAADLVRQLDALEASNRDLAERLGEQRAGVNRLDHAPDFIVPSEVQ